MNDKKLVKINERGCENWQIGGHCLYRNHAICEDCDLFKAIKVDPEIWNKKISPPGKEKPKKPVNTFVCHSCDELFSYADHEDKYGNESETDLFSGKEICGACYQDDLNEPKGTIVGFKSGENSFDLTVGHFRVLDSGNGEEYSHVNDLTKTFPGQLAFSIDWVSSSAWRGYYDVNEKKLSKFKESKDYEKVLSTWYGLGGETHGDDILELSSKKIEAKEYPIDFELIVIATRTSNVCSTGVDLYIKKAARPKFFAWLGLEDTVK